MRILIALLVLIASPVSAATITYLTDDRYIASYSCWGLAWDGFFCDELSIYEEAPTFGESWSYSTDVAPSQVSTLTPTDITLTFAVRRSVYWEEPFCDMNVRNCRSTLAPDDEVHANITFTVDQPTPSIWTTDGVATSIDLVPGIVYRFYQHLGSTSQSSLIRSYSMRLVPEPGTALLVMTAALGLAASRRRRAN